MITLEMERKKERKKERQTERRKKERHMYNCTSTLNNQINYVRP